MGAAQVLIVGAGPTGLVLAISLAKQKIPFRIIDKNSGPGLASRAMAVQSRTLEYYKQLGFADDVVASGIRMDTIEMREDGNVIGRLSLKGIGNGVSPYPFALCYPQDDHERFLTGKLAELGHQVEWNAELKRLSQTESSVEAVISAQGREETARFDYVCGCDGAHSTVRRELKLDFAGGTYDHLFYVADVKLTGPFRTEICGNLGQTGLALLMPVRSSGMQRAIGTVPEAVQDKPNLTFADIQPYVEKLMNVKIDNVNWFSSYHVHHRVASSFHVGRVFLAGDAGHIHSPAGGQGMNTGIGDAINLAWKLANVLHGRVTGSSLLNSYEQERLAFAHVLVKTTDRAFRGMIDRGLRGRILRTWIIPTLFPLLTRFTATRKMVYKTISQTGITYYDSVISDGQAGTLRGGGRLPWLGSNYDGLSDLNWRIQVYGTASADLQKVAGTCGLPIETFAWSEAAARAGFAENAAYVIRPDGYIGLATQEPAHVKAYWTKITAT